MENEFFYRYDQFTRSERDRVWKAIRGAKSMRAKKIACCAVLEQIRKEHFQRGNDISPHLCYWSEPRQSHVGQSQMCCQMYEKSGKHRLCVSPYDRFGNFKCPEYTPMKGE